MYATWWERLKEVRGELLAALGSFLCGIGFIVPDGGMLFWAVGMIANLTGIGIMLRQIFPAPTAST